MVPAAVPLDSMPEGASAVIVRLDGERSFRRRLLELGLLPGTPVRLLRRADVGEVLVIEVLRSRLTLRHRETRNILVRPA